MRRAVLLVALVSLVAGCGAKNQSTLDRANGALADSGSSRIELVFELDAKTQYVATGVYDYERHNGEVEFAVRGARDEPLLPSRARILGDTAFIAMKLDGKTWWLKEVNSEPSAPEDLIVPVLNGPGPDRVLDLLTKSSGSVNVRGSDKVRGVSATHYRIDVDLNKLIREAKAKRIPSRPRGSEFVVEAWIDDDGLLRRLELPARGEGQGQTRVDLYDFGVAVDVQAPPEAAVISDEEFSKLLEKECAMGRRAKEDDFCGLIVGEGGGGETGYGSVETVEK